LDGLLVEAPVIDVIEVIAAAIPPLLVALTVPIMIVGAAGVEALTGMLQRWKRF
jgi:hypothetical protein